MSRLEENHEEECTAPGLTIESAQSFPLIYLIGHGPVAIQKQKEFFEFIEYLGRLEQQRGDFFDSAPESRWEKLSDQGKENAEELFSMIWQGYKCSGNIVKRPIISTHYLEISPAFLKGGWYGDSEAEQILWFISLAFAGLFDHRGLTASDIIELLFKGFQSFIDFGTQLQDQLRVDLNLLQAFADVLVGRADTYADALSNLFWVGKPNDANALDAWDEVFTEILQKSVRNVLVSPSLEPPSSL